MTESHNVPQAATDFAARLAALHAAATPGPWPDSWRDPKGKFLPARYKFVNSAQAEANGRLIAHLVNHREAILALVKAVTRAKDVWPEEGWDRSEYGRLYKVDDIEAWFKPVERALEALNRD